MALPPGIEQLPSGNYRGRFTGPDGKRHTTGTYPTMEKAAHALTVARGDVARGDWLDPDHSGIILSAWFDLWMPNRQRIRPYVLEKDWARYRNHIEPWLGSHPLHKITVFAVQTWHAQLKAAGRTPATVAKAHALLKTALGPRGAMGDQRIRTNPCQLVQADPVPRPVWSLVTLEQFDRMLAKVTDPQARRVVVTVVYTGLRWSEVAGLRRADYNPLRAEITVRRGITTHKSKRVEGPTKTGKERTVPLVQRAADALAEQVAGNPMPPDAPLFADSDGGPLHHTRFMRHYLPAFPGVRFHDLRHSCISWLLNAGVPIHIVKDIAGHATIATTQLYAHADPDTVRSMMRKALEA